MKKISLPIEDFIDNLPNPVIITNNKGEIVLTNSAVSKYFGQNLGGQTIEKIFSESPLVLDGYKRVVQSKGTFSVWDVTINSENSDAEKKLDVEIFPLLNQKEKELYLLFFRDRKKYLQFEQHQKRIDRIQYLSTIASGLAHEIKNPLGGIRGASQIIERSVADPDLKELAGIIEKETMRIDSLIGDLLNFTKPKILNKEAGNINKVIHDMVLLEKTIDTDRIQFIEEYDPSLPPINLNLGAISQVFLNILRNARQSISDVSLNGSTTKGSIKIKTKIITDYSFKKGNQKRQIIGVEISDTGCGISKEIIDRIFVPFFTTKKTGSGLGLPLCHQIIEEHEGSIKINSEEGKGTTIIVLLPI